MSGTATAAKLGAGLTLGWSATSGGTATLIVELIDFVPPKTTIAKAEATRYDSPNNREEFIPSWGTSGDAEFTINYTTAETTALEAIVGVLSYWTVTLPDTHTIKFAGWISEDGLSTPNKKAMTQKFKVTTTGAIVYA